MAGFVNSQEAAVLDLFARGTTWTLPADFHFALSTTTPTEAGGNFTEPVGNNYDRRAITRNGTNFNAASGGDPTTLTNAVAIQWLQATGSWGTVTHVGIYDATTAGNLLWWAALDTSKAVANGDQPQIAIGGLTFQLGDPGDTY